MMARSLHTSVSSGAVCSTTTTEALSSWPSLLPSPSFSSAVVSTVNLNSSSSRIFESLRSLWSPAPTPNSNSSVSSSQSSLFTRSISNKSEDPGDAKRLLTLRNRLNLAMPFKGSPNKVGTVHQASSLRGVESRRFSSSSSRIDQLAKATGTQNGRNGLGRVGLWATDFNQLLADPVGLHIFTEFLEKEFSAENLMFWVSCEKYRHLERPSDRLEMSMAIMERHLGLGAPDPVNVDSHARLAVVNSLKESEARTEAPSPEVFLAAQEHIFCLMKYDSFSRFLKSDVYKQVLLNELSNKALVDKNISNNVSNTIPKSLLSWTSTIAGASLPRSKSRERQQQRQQMRKISTTSSVLMDAGDKLVLRNNSDKSNAKENNGNNSDNTIKRKKFKEENDENSIYANLKKDSIDVRDSGKNGDRDHVCSKSDDEDGIGGKNGNNKGNNNDNSDKNAPNSNSIGNKNGRSNKDDDNESCCKLARVILPDESTTVVHTRRNESIRALIWRLLEKRGLIYSSFDVFSTHKNDNRPLDLSSESTTLGCSEIRVEPRVLFRLELPSKKSIGVKAKPDKILADVLTPILEQYGWKMDDCKVEFADSKMGEVSVERHVRFVDNARLVVNHLPRLTKASSMEDKKSHSVRHNNLDRAQFSRETILTSTWSDAWQSRRSFFTRQASASAATIAEPLVNQGLYEGLKLAQRGRLDDQRGTEIRFEMPEFLKKENTKPKFKQRMHAFI